MIKLEQPRFGNNPEETIDDYSLYAAIPTNACLPSFKVSIAIIMLYKLKYVLCIIKNSKVDIRCNNCIIFLFEGSSGSSCPTILSKEQ